MKKIISSLLFLFGSLLCFAQSNANSANTPNSPQQQKLMTAQPYGELNKQPKKTSDPNTPNKLVTIAGDPHPQQSHQQKENPIQQQKQSSTDESIKPKGENNSLEEEKTVQPK